jgi:hypothetical protein
MAEVGADYKSFRPGRRSGLFDTPVADQGIIWRWWRSRQFERLAGHGSLARDSSSSGNFASNSTSEIPKASAVALLGAPSATIARTKRRSASLNFEAPHLSAASASLSACTRGVIAFRFRPDPGLAPPRPIPRDFVISNPFELFATKRSPYPQRDKSNCRTVAKSDSRRRAVTHHRLAVLCLGRGAVLTGSIVRWAARSQVIQRILTVLHLAIRSDGALDS